MENVEFPISWTNNKDDAVSVPAVAPAPVETELSFEDQNFSPPIFITLARIYDLLALIAVKIDPVEADRILNAHEAGHIIADPPYLNFEDTPPISPTD